MIKNISIVSLSSGILGEDFVKFERDIGLKRLGDMGVRVKFMPNSLRGVDYLNKHPEKRAEDLLEALGDSDTDMILCAIGGDDTYRLAPYLFENDALKNAVSDKIFLGFSDTTLNHFMLHKVGMNTFYGQAFLPDVCELSCDMLPYTQKYFLELISTGTIKQITPSDTWYESREKFDESQVGVPLKEHKNSGFELISGKAQFSGKILGGCIDSIYDMFDGERYEDMPALCKKYGLFPSLDDWKDKILLLESSEELMPPEKYEKALDYLKSTGMFGVISGIIAGKPMNGKYHDEYKRLLAEKTAEYELPMLCNISIGHALPRCIIPFGVTAEVDAEKQTITFV